MRILVDVEDDVFFGGIGNELFELDAVDVGGIEIEELVGCEILIFEGMEIFMLNLYREDNDLIIDVN